MGRGYAGKDASAFIYTEYEYAGSEFYNEMEFLDYLSYNLQMATDTKTYQHHIPDIADLAVQFAQDLVHSNGTYRTGRLHDSIKWNPTPNGFTLSADARDDYGSAYAGHIEYGFVGRDGMPHGPWPFLRPAMRMAAEASKGMFAEDAADAIFFGSTNDTLAFGRADIRHLLGNSKWARSNRSSHVHGVRREFGSKGNSTKRWRHAQHGIDHMKGLKNDTTKEGKEIYSSFQNNFGNTMSSTAFRWGEL
jgi:hypothetical protein